MTQSLPFDFSPGFTGRLLFGPGIISEAPEWTSTLGKRVLLVSGRNPDRIAPIRQTIAARLPVVDYSVSGEPTVEGAVSGAAFARSHDCDVVVAIGGGSVIDAAKAIAALATNPGNPLDYLEVIGLGHPLTADPLPVLAIPTTAGTGAEATRNAVLFSPKHRVKVSLRSPRMVPRIALLDPDLTLSLPRAETASTGLDALTQLIESFVSIRANPFTDSIGRFAIPRVARALPRVLQDGADREARCDMALGAFASGVALASAGLGAVHGFAGPLGGMYAAPHGQLCAALLAPVLRVNHAALLHRTPHTAASVPTQPPDAPNPIDRFALLADWLTGQPCSPGTTHAVETAIEWIEALVQDTQIPRLSAWGIAPPDFPDIISKATQSSSMKGNPIPLTVPELETILRLAL